MRLNRWTAGWIAGSVGVTGLLGAAACGKKPAPAADAVQTTAAPATTAPATTAPATTQATTAPATTPATTGEADAAAPGAAEAYAAAGDDAGGGGADEAYAAPGDDAAANGETTAAAGEPGADGVKPTPIKAGQNCLPTWEDPNGQRSLAIHNLGGGLVLCAFDLWVGPVGCWDVDAATGKLTSRATAALPGIGFAVHADRCYEGLCWSADVNVGGDGAVPAIVAYHPDGKRAAVMVGETVLIYDLASKKATSTFKLRDGENVGEGQISNAPVTLWFLGETVFVAGTDAGPAAGVWAYSVSGKAVGLVDFGLYNGSASVLDADHLAVNSNGLTELVVADAKTGKVTQHIKRSVPKGPCDLPAEWDAEAMGEDQKPCFDWVQTNFKPFADLEFMRTGDGFLAFSAWSGELVTLDKTLHDKGRVKLERCAP